MTTWSPVSLDISSSSLHASERSRPSNHNMAPTSTHPLGPLSKGEISHATALIKSQWPEGTKFQFKILTLLEPPKDELVPYLEAERAGRTPKPINRKAQVVYYLRNTVSNLFYLWSLTLFLWYSPLSPLSEHWLTAIARINSTRLLPT